MFSLKKISIVTLAFALLVNNTLAFQSLSTTPGDSGFQSAGAWMLSKDASNTFNRSTDSLEAIRDRLDALLWTANGNDTHYTTGNVGIGITAPTSDLHIQGADPAITLDTTTALDTDFWLGVIEDELGTDDDLFQIGDGIVVGTNPFLTIDTNGKVGIGTTSPSSLLEMSSASPYLTIHNTTHEDTDYGREGELIFKGEQSGGEETTLGKIQVAHDGVADDQKGIMSFKVNDGTDGDAPTTAMTILANGNVGIGTDNPTGKLEVNHGEGTATRNLFLTSNTAATFWPGFGMQHGAGTNLGMIISSNGTIGFQRRDADYSNFKYLLKLHNSGGVSVGHSYHSRDPGEGNVIVVGNIGIGTTNPKNKLDIEGGLAVGAGYSGTNTAPSNGAIIEGNVGIGTNNPTQQFELTGNFEIPNTTHADGSGIIYKGGNAFIHNFNYGNNGTVTTMGENIFIGKTVGNFTMGSTATQAYQASSNSAIGSYVLRFNTTGYSNSAMGKNALYSNTTGSYNSAMGYSALYSNTGGSYNSAIGRNALQSNTTGGYNSAIGGSALRSNTTGGSNFAMGSNAGRYIADGATGNTTGDSNIFLGSYTKALADNDQNETVIGNNAIGVGSNSVVLGNDSVTKTILKGNVGVGTTDPKNKLDIEGGLAVGAGYSGTYTAPSNGAIIEGNVGIGTDNPKGKLHLFSGSSGVATPISLADNFIVEGNDNTGFTIITPDDKLAGFGFGSASDNLGLYMEYSYNGGYGKIGTHHTGHKLMFGAGQWNVDMTILSTGNIGIGTQVPKNKLDIEGGLAVGAGYSGTYTAPSNGAIIEGNVGIGTAEPQSALHVPDGNYAQFEDNNAGAPLSTDCDADTERGRMSIDTANNRLYICNGATRGWDYVTLTD